MTHPINPELREQIAKIMKFWKASDGSYWSTSKRVCVDRRLDKLMDLVAKAITEAEQRGEIKGLSRAMKLKTPGHGARSLDYGDGYTDALSHVVKAIDMGMAELTTKKEAQ